MQRGIVLELFTALPTSCAADQSQSYSSAGRSSGGPVRGLGPTAGVCCGKALSSKQSSLARWDCESEKCEGCGGEWGVGGTVSDNLTYASGRESRLYWKEKSE